MMSSVPSADLDLAIRRVIKAPRRLVWGAWADPASFAEWWVPAPARCKVVAMELRPGGALITEISEVGGAFQPHMNACFLDVAEGERIVFTDTLTGGWRPAEHPFMSAIISFADHPDGTDYRAHVMHKSRADRDRHVELGFHDGWGTVAAQLAALAEQRAAKERGR
jgi:uncharacterized protein YndB with AHSA1/START domain